MLAFKAMHGTRYLRLQVGPLPHIHFIDAKTVTDNSTPRVHVAFDGCFNWSNSMMIIIIIIVGANLTEHLEWNVSLFKKSYHLNAALLKLQSSNDSVSQVCK